MPIEWDRIQGIGRCRQTAGRSRIPPWFEPYERPNPEIRNEVPAEPVEAPNPVAAPDARVRAFRGHARRSAVASIRLLHQVPPIPPGLTRTGSLIVYYLRWKISRSPRPPLVALPRQKRRKFLDYVLQARHIVSMAYEMLKIGDAVFGRGRRNTEEASQVNLSLVPCRKTIAYCIMRSLLVLQATTDNRIYHCLLCDQAPAALRAEEPPRQNYVGTNILEVRSWRWNPEHSTLTEMVTILPPMEVDHYRYHYDALLCGLHRYVFQFLVYQNVNPSWPVPYLRRDRARYGDIDVPRWNPATQTVHFEEPRRS